jgi:hypothetical protein
MRGALQCALVGTVGCVVGNLSLSGFDCDAYHPCENGYVCVPTADGGTCQLASDAGPACTTHPTCTPNATGLQLCDGEVTPCAAGSVCDYGTCVLECVAAACGANQVCDTSVNACVATSACAPDGGACDLDRGQGICLAGVCVPTPPLSGTPVTLCSAADGGSGMVQISGAVALFPSASVSAVLIGGTVTFTGPGGALPPASIVPASGTGLPSYTISVPEGTWTAIVQLSQTTTIATYFPDLEVGLPNAGNVATLDLDAVVGPDLVAMLSRPAWDGGIGYEPRAGHITWVARGATCDGSSFLGDVTIGLSPFAPYVGYYTVSGSSVEIQPGASSTSSSIGEILALDAPYSPTSYALAVGGSPLQGPTANLLRSGTFTPPAYQPNQIVAVALIYPDYAR